MKAALLLLVAGILFAEADAQSLRAASLLQDSRERVEALERKAASIGGTLVVSVSFNAEILGRKAFGKAGYRITVKDGNDVGSEQLDSSTFSDSASEKMMDRQFRRRLNKPMMDFYYDSAYPWNRYLSRANKKREFTAKVDSDSALVDGKKCFLISFNLDAEGDSISADGEGKIWIDAKTLLPVRAERDFNTRTSRGNAEVKSSSEFGSLPDGLPVLLRIETQTIPKFLFISIGSIRTVVKQSDFNLE